jgi:hypothetical protein
MVKRTVSTLLSVIILAACGASTGTSSSGVAPGATPSATPAHGSTPTATPGHTPTPAPTAVPTPVTKLSTTTCSFVWASADVDIAGTIDYYQVNIRASAWKNTTTAFDGTNAVGYFVIAYDPANNGFLDAGMTTSGTFSIMVGTTAMGQAATFADTSTHDFFDATGYFAGSSSDLGVKVASGGIGTFSGKLSSAASGADVTPGTGNVTATDDSGDVEEFADPNLQSEAYSVCDPAS